MQTLDLSGKWTMSSPQLAGRAFDINLPGDNYSVLLEAGVIPDPYYGDNELRVQEYRTYTWEFTREFEASEELLAEPHVYLEATMVDTFCTIRINGKAVARCQNQFAAYRPDVRRQLRAGVNTIALTIHPLEAEAAKYARRLPMQYPMSGNCHVTNMNLVRKPHCAGGWDWGVCLCTSGVYAPLTLQATPNARLDYIYTDQKHQQGRVAVTATAELFAAQDGVATVRFSFNGQEKEVKAKLKAGDGNKVSALFQVENPKLWWPNGYGEQPLYPLTVTCQGLALTRQIGLRSLEIINKRDRDGLPMTFRINGMDIFCKGADWIPCDAFPARQTKARFDDLLESARIANMNMLRVWGGGQYEQECFYELCDQKGLLVWQDMMFSCSLYPSDEEFIANVSDELRHQLRRLRSHASLALWCGDNEVLGATKWYGGNHTAWVVNYDRLNRELGRLAAKYDPSRVFWPSSPCGGPGNLSDGWHNDSEGDMHYWEVWHGDKDFTAYYRIKPRFCSEFGYQSFPSLETVRSYCPEADLNLFSSTMDYHQKCVKGNSPMIAMMSKYFRMPSGLPAALYLSQLQQALAIKTGVEYWRTLKPRCMGTIFWQLNDDWPVASWASLEYSGKWKQLQYHARRFYSPVISTIVTPEADAQLFASSDVNCAGKLTVQVECRDCQGTIRSQNTFACQLEALSSTRFAQFSAEDVAQWAKDGLFVHIATLFTADDGRVFTHENDFFPQRFKALPMEETQLQSTIRAAGEDGAFEVTLQSDKPAFFVVLDAPGIPGIFSDNSFTLLPGKPRVIRFAPKRQCVLEEFRAALEVMHLRQTW